LTLAKMADSNPTQSMSPDDLDMFDCMLFEALLRAYRNIPPKGDPRREVLLNLTWKKMEQASVEARYKLLQEFFCQVPGLLEEFREQFGM